MKYLILHVICEGKTEQKFVKEVLSPYFCPFSIFPKAHMLTTSMEKKAYGGMISYLRSKNDLLVLMKKFRNNNSETHLFTTMFDYYGLPNDFPGFDKASSFSDVRQKISFLENEFSKDINNESFIPYIQLHEFEALLFTDISKLSTIYSDCIKEIITLKEETDQFGDPEMINNSPDTAPSKRIINALKNKYDYNKVSDGIETALAIGIDTLLNNCLHFKDWINRIINKACEN